MQHFFLTQGLAEFFPTGISEDPPSNNNAWFWFGHLVHTQSGPFVLLMESRSRYCLVLHNPIIRGLAGFTYTFEQHLRQHVIAVTQADDKLAKRISLTVASACKNTKTSVGMDYSVSTDLFEIACQLQYVVEQIGGYPLPGISELSLALYLNQQPRADSDGNQLIPLEAFQRQWQEQLGISAAAQAPA